jgi:anti-sigma factor ChrR (cupin superfamily)
MNDDKSFCEHAESVAAYVVHALPASEVPTIETHLTTCASCRQDLESLRPVADKLISWPTDVLRPTGALQTRLAQRIAGETGKAPVVPPPRQWSEPEWEHVAPGIFVKLLANDTVNHRISMLVRLIPGANYPPHIHAGVEELYLLDGELWIDDRLLFPGDYNYGAPGAGDKRVYSETGCTCVLVTSTQDVLG